LSASTFTCAFFSTFILSVLALVASEAKTVVVLDPGHGGKDNGARWYGVSEKTLNLDVAKRVEVLLKKRGIPVVMTRRTDTYVSLDYRAKIANRHAGAVFVSIHFNAHSNRSIKGIETFYISSKGKKLAQSMQKRLASRINTNDRGSKKHHYAVLTKTRGVAALVECGFISNHWENRRCSTSWFRDILAQEIASGISAYCNTL
jgi:N-acetylmuramoyl-L-alanine amidase